MKREHMRMTLSVAKWGNSLAVRLPAESARLIGIGEGDTLTAEISADGRLILAADTRALGKAGSRRLREFLGPQPVTEPVVARMRRESRY